MKGSPAKLGTIQGTAGHASALKQKAKTYEEAYEDIPYTHGPTGSVDRDVVKEVGWEKTDPWGKKYGTRKPNPDWKNKEAEVAASKASKKGKAEFTKAAKAWNMKTYGTTEPTRDAKKGGMTKKELAAQYKASRTTVEPAKTETPVTTDKPTEKTKVLESKTFVPKKKGLGAKKGKTLSMADKSTEKAAIATQKTKIKTAKKSGDKTGRDEGQLEKAQIKSGRDNKYTGTRLSRYLAKLKVKRNKRQLKNRKTETTD